MDLAIRGLFGGRIPRATYLSLILPDQAFFLGTLTLSSVALRTNPLALLEREIQSTAPLPLREYRLAFEAGTQVGSRHQVHFCALPKEVVADLEGTCSRLGLIPLAIQPSFLRLLHLLRLVDKEPSPYPSVLVHVGHESTTLAIYTTAGLKRVHSLPFGGTDLDRLLAGLEERDPQDPEEFKKRGIILLEDPASDAQADVPAYRRLEPLFVQFLQKLYAFLQSHTAEFPNEGCFRRIVLSGGTGCLRHLDRLIVANLGIPVTPIGAMFDAIGPHGPLSPEDKGLWAPVLGDLALQPWRIDRFDRVAAA